MVANLTMPFLSKYTSCFVGISICRKTPPTLAIWHEELSNKLSPVLNIVILRPSLLIIQELSESLSILSLYNDWTNPNWFCCEKLVSESICWRLFWNKSHCCCWSGRKLCWEFIPYLISELKLALIWVCCWYLVASRHFCSCFRNANHCVCIEFFIYRPLKSIW